MATSFETFALLSPLSCSSNVSTKRHSSSFPCAKVDHHLYGSTVELTMRTGTCRKERSIQENMTVDRPENSNKVRNLKGRNPVRFASKRLDHYQLLTHPMVTEAAEKNLANKTIIFSIDIKADTKMIKDAVERFLPLLAGSMFTSIRQKFGRLMMAKASRPIKFDHFFQNLSVSGDPQYWKSSQKWIFALSSGVLPWLASSEVAYSASTIKLDPVYEVGELFELGIQLSYLLILLALLGVGTFFVIRQVLLRRELDLSAKELQEQVRSGGANATELFELGAVMLRRKFYPAATKYLQQAIEKWDGDDQDLAQVYNALGVSYIRDGKLEKGIAQFENAVKLQPGYVTAWNNLGDAYEKKKDLNSALKAFEEVVLLDPNNPVGRPRADALRDRVKMYKGVPIKSKDR